MDEPKVMNVSLIGIGGYGKKIAAYLQQIPGVNIVCCFHPDPDKCRAAAEHLGCRAARDENEAVGGPGIDTVVVATPDPCHFDYVKRAIRAGRHIFVDKPMVGTLHEARQLRDLMTGYSGVFFVGHNMRRAAGFRKIRQLYLSGRLGELVAFDVRLSHGGAFRWGTGYWRSSRDDCREGPLRVNGVHASDVLEYLFGPVESVFAKFNPNVTAHAAPDTGLAMARVCGIYGSISTSWVIPSIDRFHFEFTDAVADYDLKTLSLRRGRDVDCVPNPVVPVALDDVDGRYEQFVELEGAVTAGGTVETGFEEGYRGVLFFEACYRSVREHREIKLSEMENESTHV
ncbi:hypothetical protein D3OALGA1CA_423 [Olavius algarvensis associated proteobacterium Delta 3]|nr:hypothetical protein D3OALGA1CA_423 [Olavius algarvensis associated proteobacterium Delta 3]CAB5114027.1 hypothetical protein D3OALGB2SA_2565 [Olavius algarvensis associated proteobacterium Delta 3]